MEAKKLVGWNVRRLRVAKEMTIEDLADRARASSWYVSHLERGRINPTLDMLEQIAKPLGVKLVDLLAELPPGTKAPKPLPGGRRPRRY